MSKIEGYPIQGKIAYYLGLIKIINHGYTDEDVRFRIIHPLGLIFFVLAVIILAGFKIFTDEDGEFKELRDHFTFI